MASDSQYLVSPFPLTLPSGTNSFVSNWADKRSAPNFGISIVFYNTGSPPDGYAWIETSNAPAAAGTGFGQPANGGDDVQEYPGSQLAITLMPLGSLYGAQWQIANCGAHYVRVRYTANTNKSGLTVNVYYTGSYSSQ